MMRAKFGCLTVLVVLAAFPASAQPWPDDAHIDVVMLTLSLLPTASPERVAQAMSQAREAASHVQRCEDLHREASKLPDAYSSVLHSLSIEQISWFNREYYREIRKLAPGGVAGPFRVAEGVQIVALCGPSLKKNDDKSN
jgi:peptidyl-prolyl cis-trans isomerase SurA